jgi:acyl-CoA synthetase (AMP-forming)/AMP-acid ligase II
MPNRPELAVALYACFRTGAIAVPLNIRSKTAELAPLLQRLQPALYIGDADLHSQIEPIDSSILHQDSRFVVGDTGRDTHVQPWASLLRDAAPDAPSASNVRSPAVLLATAGTTGVPKFVVHTDATLAAAADLWKHLGLQEGQTAAVVCPMVHASGLFTFLACIQFGAPMVLLERFEADRVLDAIELHRCNWLLGLPYMFAALLECQRARPRDVASLQFCLSAGDVCPSRLQQEFTLVSGVPLRSVWAATEAPGSLAYGLEPGPVSRISPVTQVRLVDDAGTSVLPGEVGELVVCGPNVSTGYWAGPGLIEDAPERGWYHTGDLMRQDDKGDLWFVSRRKDLIVSGGSNISPVEVERVLAAHPAIADAAVVGIPEDVLGQRVTGFVQLRENAPLRILGDVLDWLRADLADYKVPERLHVVPSILRNALGKTDRKALAAMIVCQSSDPTPKPRTAPHR